MKITEAAKALAEGKTINSANAQATIKPFEVENQQRVTVTRVLRSGHEDVMDMSLTRVKQLYALHDFALGQYKSATPPANKAAAPPEIK